MSKYDGMAILSVIYILFISTDVFFQLRLHVQPVSDCVTWPSILYVYMHPCLYY